jgi:mannosyltransferase
MNGSFMKEFLFNHTPILYFIQSLWRDEAFSILAAERPLSFLLPKLTFEPPVYYILLHYWIQIFGNSEIASRSLSLLGFTFATVVVIFWAEALFKKSWLSWFLPVFFFVNPMLLYYAFEVRTYGWYMFFATLSMYAYTQKKWRLLTVATVLGFYTHSYFIFTFITQIVHYAIISYRKLLSRGSILKGLTGDRMIRSSMLSILIISPWIIRMLGEAGKLRQSWYYPVDLHLVKSVLGNMFIGYEGTPWYLWSYTALLSVGLAGIFLAALKNNKTNKQAFYFFLATFIPLSLVIGASFIKPLFVNRYLIPVTIAQIFLVVLAISTVKNSILQKIFGLGLLAAVLAFNVWYPSKRAKKPIRETVLQINMLKNKNDLIYATSPLILFETIYYSKDRSEVYLYNPANSPFPWYVGDILVQDTIMAKDLPLYPVKAYLVNRDGTYAVAYQYNYKSVENSQETPDE